MGRVAELGSLGVMTILRNKRAFVGNELFIVLGCLALSVVGAVILARALHLSWFFSISLVVAVIVILLLVLSFVFTPRKRQ